MGRITHNCFIIFPGQIKKTPMIQIKTMSELYPSIITVDFPLNLTPLFRTKLTP